MARFTCLVVYCAGIEIRDWKRGTCPPSVLGSFSPLAAAVEWNVIHRNSRNGELAAHNAMLRYSAAQDELLDRFRNGLESQPPVDPELLCTLTCSICPCHLTATT